MLERTSEINIYRKAYERQNSALLGAAGMIFSAVCIVVICITGIQGSAYGRSRGQIKADGTKTVVTQELLDYLGTLKTVRSAAPVIELQGSIEIENYIYTGTITGIDIKNYPFEYAAAGRMSGSSFIQMVFGSQVPKEFQKKDGGKVSDAERETLLQKLSEGEMKLQIGEAYSADGSMGTAAGAEDAQNVQSAVMSGILRQTGDSQDNRIYVDITQIQRFCRMMGEEDTPKSLVIGLYHKKDAAEVLNTLNGIGFKGENPYRGRIEEQGETDKNLRIYFGMSGLLLLFSGLYLKKVVW
ncbi:hypothetical protein [Murimonas intestini]|uniref:hypothetical protein n=1 Tax=Murimonas intestini TaxID=1337051 RepID=UPI0011DCC15B|nr:hypothetical protein [Murimonas intestini]